MAYWDRIREKSKQQEERAEAEYHAYVEEHSRLPTMNHRELWSRINKEHGEEGTEYTF
jgi:hypothetical protein